MSRWRIRYALNKTTGDRWPIEFRPNCERTKFNAQTGQDQSLLEVMEELLRNGYELVEIDELEQWLSSQGDTDGK